MQTHALLGARIAREILDDEQVQWVLSHHERPDGCGTLDGLILIAVAAGDMLGMATRGGARAV